MSRSDRSWLASISSVVQEIADTYGVEQLANLRALLANPFVVSLVRSGDSRGLAKLLGMSFYTFLDYLKDAHGLTFKQYATRREWCVAGRGLCWSGPDDCLHTVSCGALRRLQRVLPESVGTSVVLDVYSGGNDILYGAVAAVDRQGLRASSRFFDQFQPGFSTHYDDACVLVQDLPSPEHCTGPQRAKWGRYINVVTELFVSLRLHDKPILVPRDVAPSGAEEVDWKGAMQRCDSPHWIWRTECDKAAPFQLEALEAMIPEHQELVVLESDGHLVVFPKYRDAFELIGHEFYTYAMPPIPGTLEGDVPLSPEAAAPPPPVRPAGSLVGYGGEGLDFCVGDGFDEGRKLCVFLLQHDFNSFDPVQRDAFKNCGAEGSKSRKAYESVSGTRREVMTKQQPLGDLEFAERARIMRKSAGTDWPDDVASHICACRLGKAKGQIRFRAEESGLVITK